MKTPYEVTNYTPTKLTKPLRFRIPNEDYILLCEYAKQHGYSLGGLGRAITDMWIERFIKKPMREAERQQVAELFPDVD